MLFCEQHLDIQPLSDDYFSTYPEIRTTIRNYKPRSDSRMKSTFASHGILDVVVSDKGPQYASDEFAIFAEEWDFRHVTSSHGYTQSSGQAGKDCANCKESIEEIAK